MFGRFGGEGTDQEGCRTQQVADLQYVAPCDGMSFSLEHDGANEIGNLANSVQLVRLLLRNKKSLACFLRYHDQPLLLRKPALA